MLGREARLRHAAIVWGYATRLLLLLLRRHTLHGRAPGLGLGKIQRGSAGAERAQRWLCGFCAQAQFLLRCGLLLLRGLRADQREHQVM